jgi:hypothetical protein
MIPTLAAVFFIGTIIGSLFRDLVEWILDLYKSTKEKRKPPNRRPWDS